MSIDLTLYKQISMKLEHDILAENACRDAVFLRLVRLQHSIRAEQFLDDTCDNDTMERLYPNMVFLTEIGQ